MRNDVELKLIEYLVVTSIGDYIPSINKMSKEILCSRGKLQDTIKNYESKGYIKTTKSKAGTALLDIDYKSLANIYFTNLNISSALYTNSISTERLTEKVIANFNDINLDTYITFSDSTLHRLELLFKSDVNFALVSDVYYDKLNLATSNIEVYHKFVVQNTVQTKMIISDKPNLLYSVDEVPDITNESSINSQTPDCYYLVCQKHVSKLLPYLKQIK